MIAMPAQRGSAFEWTPGTRRFAAVVSRRRCNAAASTGLPFNIITMKGIHIALAVNGLVSGANSWTKAVARRLLKTRPNRWPLERIMAESHSRTSIKRRLLEAGLLKNRCEECGLEGWRGLPLSMQLDHRNGRKHDNRLTNLRMLCPNCHSQTATFGTRNRRRGQV